MGRVGVWGVAYLLRLGRRLFRGCSHRFESTPSRIGYDLALRPQPRRGTRCVLTHSALDPTIRTDTADEQAARCSRAPYREGPGRARMWVALADQPVSR